MIEHKTLPVTDLVLKDDEDSYSRSDVQVNLRGLSASLRILDLDIKRVSRDFSDHECQTDFGDPKPHLLPDSPVSSCSSKWSGVSRHTWSKSSSRCRSSSMAVRLSSPY